MEKSLQKPYLSGAVIFCPTLVCIGIFIFSHRDWLRNNVFIYRLILGGFTCCLSWHFMFWTGGSAAIFMKVVLSGVPDESAGAGTGTYGLFRDLSAPFGVTVFVPLFTN